MDDWQLAYHLIKCDPRIKDVADVRSRGGSKTMDNVIDDLYFAYLGWASIYFTSSQDQAGQPKEYYNLIITHSFLQYVASDVLKEECRFRNGGWFRLRNLTGKKARSSRADYVYYDEMRDMEEEDYNASKMILSASTLALRRYGSTAQKGSLFSIVCKTLRKRGFPVLLRKYNEISFLNQEDIEAEREVLPGWLFRQEFMCSEELPFGKVFIHVVEGNFSHLLGNNAQNQMNFGLDWNPAAGHYLVGSQWAKDFTYCIVILEENLGSDLDIVFPKIVTYMNRYPSALLEIEDGGTNLGYCDSFFKYLRDKAGHYRDLSKSEENGDARYQQTLLQEKYNSIITRTRRKEWDTMGKNKMEAITNLLPIPIYVNKSVTPDVFEWIDKAQWDGDAGKPQLKKTPDQHPLDGFLHSAYVGRDKIKFEMSWVD